MLKHWELWEATENRAKQGQRTDLATSESFRKLNWQEGDFYNLTKIFDRFGDGKKLIRLRRYINCVLKTVLLMI